MLEAGSIFKAVNSDAAPLRLANNIKLVKDQDTWYEVKLRAGDVNIDRFVDVTDLVRMKRIISETEKSALDIQMSDMDGDEDVDGNDCSKMRERLVSSSFIKAGDSDYAIVYPNDATENEIFGKHGTIMEWLEDYEEADPGHRHSSHLYALYPSRQITKDKTPDLYQAAKNTIERRIAHGCGHIGWSMAWLISFYARLHDGVQAEKNLYEFFKHSTLSNLFDSHPPF